MKFIETLQTKSKEEAKKAISEQLSMRALDVLNEIKTSDLLKGAEKAYIDATRQGNGVMAKQYSKDIEKHKAALKKEKPSIKLHGIVDEPKGRGESGDREMYAKANKALTKEETLLEYHATGTVGDQKFKIATNDEYDEEQVASQNPHLSPKHVKAVVAHTESDEFLDDNNVITTQNGLTVKSNSGGYYGDVDNKKAKYTKE